jgi:magnesium-transporting ATPase (P-type)
VLHDDDDAPGGGFGRRLDAWHAAAADEALEALCSSRHGLTAPEVDRRRSLCGPNRLPQAARRGPLLRVLLQFHNVFIYAPLASAVVSGALEAIRGMIDPRATALRDGRRLTIAAEDLVPGDLVLLEPGDRVPADLRLVRSRRACPLC